MKMNTRYVFAPELVCGSVNSVTFSSISDDPTAVIGRNTAIRVPPSSFLIRMAMRVSRARWYSFLRRVFHYQNGSARSDLGSNPFNSGTWMVMELYSLLFQITVISYTLSVSNEERPVWPMRIWVAGYDIGCVFSLVLLGWRYRVLRLVEGNGSSPGSTEVHRSSEDLRSWTLMNKFRTCMELFFAIWFVMGNVWVFDSRFGSFQRAPKLHLLCIFLLSWNAITYSFPFILFVLLCCCVPLISTLLGYNMNMGSVDRGASDEQLSELPSWKYKDVGNDLELGNSAIKNENQECCICLAKYKDKEEIRQLPCSHIFHLNCVDQWLRILSCCPLCKQEVKR